MKQFRYALGICLLIGLIGNGWPSQAPEQHQPPAEVVEKQRLLLDIVHSITQFEQELQAKQEELRSPQAEGRQEELQQQIRKLGAKLETFRANLNEVASGVDLAVFAPKDETSFDWQQSLLKILQPVVSELTRLTSGPREIEHLRATIAQYQTQYQIMEKALANLTQLMAHQQDPAVAPLLRQLHQEWETQRQEIDTQLSITRQQLKRKLDEQPSLQESARNLLQLFFRSRGRNFILACVAFASFWLAAHHVRRWLHKRNVLRGAGGPFSVRLFHVVYTFASVVGATVAFLLVLYFFRDWVLLTVALMFLLGIAWTSKHTLPRFVREVLLLLNVGAVREGERVIYNGIPWQIRSLHFYTRLVNPELQGGDIRLPLRDFHDLRSRPLDREEPWFPTREDDWVLLQDQTLGKVVLQTPEVVRLVLLGGSRVAFSTQHFLAQTPIVLSTGFRLNVSFGVDYQHQALVTQHIPAQLQTMLREAFERAGYTKHLRNLKIEFAEAGASSLDVMVIADCTGAAAPHYYELRRMVQRICVEACNTHGWVIPFTQLTLHMAPTNGEPLPLVAHGLGQPGERNPAAPDCSPTTE